MELKKFLKKVKERLNNKIEQIVVGNESADLDSIISANILAYTYNKLGKSNVVPLINCNRGDYKLRTESYGLLKRYDVDESDLIFIDDIDSSLIDNPADIKVTVVDHNKLPDNLRNWDNNVVAVFDHHQDIDMYKNSNPRIFETVGSCSTLVGKYILENKADIYETEEIAVLNLSPILVDTVNLDREQGRVTEEDIETFNKIKKYTSVDTEKLYNDLQYMKSDVSSLSSIDLLRKDYKQWANSKMTYGMASVPLSIADWLNKDKNITSACDTYMKDNNLDMLIVMTAYVNEKFNRELIIMTQDNSFINDFVNMLNIAGLELSEYNKEFTSENEVKVFNQGGLGFSRKKIQPLIETFLTKL